MNVTPVRCPFCGSSDSDLFSLFGQQLLTVQYYCNACRTPFEKVRDAFVMADARAQTEIRTRDHKPQRGSRA